jgi:hypothetical protein
MDVNALLNIALGRDTTLAGAAPKAGERLAVQVLQVREDGKVLVDCGRFRARADVSFPVAVGEQFTVKVLDARGTLRLEVVRPQPAAGVELPAEAPPADPVRPIPDALLREVQAQSDRLLSALPGASAADADSGGLASALTRVAELLRPLELRTGGNAPERLQDFCRNSGLFLETRLQELLTREAAEGPAGRPVNAAALRRILAADLKAQLAAIVRGLEAGEPALAAGREANDMAQSARALLAEIVRQQGEITRTADDARQFTLVHFSLPLNAPQGGARLKVGFPRRRRKRPGDGHRAALLVELDRLGTVRADLHLVERSLSADLFVSRPEIKPVVQEHVTELRESLSPLFADVRVTVRVSEKKVADFEWEDLGPAVAGRLDVRA